VDDWKMLEQRVSNGDKLDTAEEATLSKLTADDSCKKHDCESYQSNMDDWKMLEQRVSNFDKLDTVEEATLSKLTAAHESKKKHSHDNYQSIAVKNRWSTDDDSMLAQLVGKYNFTRTKWTELSCQVDSHTEAMPRTLQQ
jgi:hypothetical protein